MIDPPEPPDEFSNTPKIPHNPEAEEAVLGCILIDEDTFQEARELLDASDFYIIRNREVWEAMVRLNKKKMAIDLNTVSDELQVMGSDVGFPRLTQLICVPSSSLNIASYCQLVATHSVFRKMITKASAIASIAYKGLSLEDALVEYDKLIHEDDIVSYLNDETEDSDDASLKLIAKIRGGVPTGVKSGFPLFDDPASLGGFPVGASLLIGDSSFGKSAWGLQLCEQVALAGNVAEYFGLESSNEAMVLRRVGGASGVDTKKVRTASLTQAEEDALVLEIVDNYQGRYGGRLKLNSKAVNLRDIERAIRHHRPKFAVIDQISQIVDAPSPNPTINLLSNFARLKAIGNKYDCAMLVIHALSPEESREFFKKNQRAQNSAGKLKNSVPNINAIPWASQMKFLADVVLVLVPEVNQKLAKAKSYDILIWIMKDRDGGRFTDTWWTYDLILQWFTDIPKPVSSNAQAPSTPMTMFTPNVSQVQAPVNLFGLDDDEEEVDTIDYDTSAQ